MYSSLRNQPHDYILMIVYASVSQAWVAEQWRVLCCISHLLFVLFRFSQAQSQSGRQGDQALTSVSGSRTSLQRSLKHTKRKACIACHQRQVQGPYRGGRGEGLSLSTDHCITCLMVTSTDFCFWRFDAVLQESERYAYEWQRCLENALEVCGCFFFSMFMCFCVWPDQSVVWTNGKYFKNYIMESCLPFLLKCHVHPALNSDSTLRISTQIVYAIECKSGVLECFLTLVPVLRSSPKPITSWTASAALQSALRSSIQLRAWSTFWVGTTHTHVILMSWSSESLDVSFYTAKVPVDWNEKSFTELSTSLSLSGVVEVYRVTKRVELGIKATAVCSEKLQQLLKDIHRVWNNLMGFMSLAKLTVRYSETSAQTSAHIFLCYRPGAQRCDSEEQPVISQTLVHFKFMLSPNRSGKPELGSHVHCCVCVSAAGISFFLLKL